MPSLGRQRLSELPFTMTKKEHSSHLPYPTPSHSTLTLPTVFDWDNLQTLDSPAIHQEIWKQSRPLRTDKDLTPYHDLLKLIKEHFPAFKMPATINLKSSDGVVMAVGESTQLPYGLADRSSDSYPADKDVAERSHLIKNMIEDLPDESLKEDVPITNASLLEKPVTSLSLTHHI